MAESTPSREVVERPAPHRDTARVGPRPRIRETERAARTDMRIVVFAPRLELDGTTLFTRTLIQALRHSGDRVMLVSPGGPLLETLTGAFHLHFQLPQEGRLGFFEWRKLKAALTEFHPDVMHAVVPGSSLPARAADFLGCPLAVSVHGVRDGETPRPGDNAYDAYVASDQAVRQALHSIGLERDRITVVPDAVSPGQPPPEKESPASPLRAAVGWIGVIEARTGYQAFIQAAEKLEERAVDVVATILGAGQDVSAAHEAVNELGLQQRLIVVEHLFDYSNIWQPFDIVVVDSRQPASALLVLHAMAGGRPVIATEGGAVFDLIEDGVDGVIVPRDQPDAMAERIEMLVRSPRERLRMGQAAFARVEQHRRAQDMAAALNTIYTAMLMDEPLPKSFETGRLRRK